MNNEPTAEKSVNDQNNPITINQLYPEPIEQIEEANQIGHQEREYQAESQESEGYPAQREESREYQARNHDHGPSSIEPSAQSIGPSVPHEADQPASPDSSDGLAPEVAEQNSVAESNDPEAPYGRKADGTPRKRPPGNPTGKNSPEGALGRIKPRNMKAQFIDKLAVFTDYYINQRPVPEIAKAHDTSVPYIYTILRDKELRAMMDNIRKSQMENMTQAMSKNLGKIDILMEKYLDLALDDDRVAVSSLSDLFRVYGIVADKQLNMEALALKKEELEVRKLEAEKAAQANKGLIADFMAVIQGANSIPAISPEEEKEAGDQEE